MASNLQGRVILITGASAGIGAATALACAREGMSVILAARRKQRLEELARVIRAEGGTALPVVCDVSSDRDVRAAFDLALTSFPRLDAVFANAGYGLFQPVARASMEEAHAIFETNFFGTVRCVRHAVPAMVRQGGGHILICTSACSEISLPMYGYYSATKAAQDSIAGALRVELAGAGIHVSTVHPIGTRTEFFDVAARLAGDPDIGLNTPAALMHSSEKVARGVVRCLRRPRCEVWPSPGTRFGVALTTAFPFLAHWALRNIVARRYRRDKYRDLMLPPESAAMLAEQRVPVDDR